MTRDLATALLRGDRRALARGITLTEQGGPEARALLRAIYPYTGRAHIVGVTGAPGVGKSTLVSALVAEWRRRGRSVGVVAVDPSSPFSGGAILGDRIRMQAHGGDAGVFIRSMASRGRLGGIARATGDAVALLDAAGFDVALVETVGAGQGEVEIAGAAHTTLVIEVPGMGDDVQSIKAGILEIADVFVVNKADREGADATVRQLRAMLRLADAPREGWTPPVLTAVATRGEGVPQVVDAAEQHLQHLRADGQLDARLRARAAYELRLAVQEAALERARARAGGAGWNELVDQIAARRADPYSAAAQLLGE
ncbi:MAG TPA: methylmalonyl Co-A mutase-associated GTPase MeaB [Roseiflexaceae bacterium]|nr:methylmalonyl Co-A mutase-associated GTPase MeaB [Roseiflexaceae bacterium]